MTSGGPSAFGAVNLCETCRHARRVETKRGSVFLLCERSKTDPRYPRYPMIPVLACRGHETAGD